jgi:branched-chain amino acid transport system ATP-binding protein
MSRILTVRGLEASYDKLKILKGIDFDVEEGDLVAIIGPNGSGKSTTLKSIFGILKPSKGKIMLRGEKISGLTADKIAKKGIAYVPQGRMVFQTLTVEENLEMGAFTIKDKELKRKRLEEIYSRFLQLKEKRKQKATFLSGGQQQLLSMARALILKPKIMLLDEPSLGLDPGKMEEMFSLIKKINKEGTTVILVEQNALMALEIANKVIVLRTGKIAYFGKTGNTTTKKLNEIYFGKL